MAKKPAPAPATFEPYVARDPYCVVEGAYFGRVLVVGRTFCGVRAVKRVVHVDHVMLGVREQVIPDWQRGAYTPLEETSLQSFISGLKNEALAHGATPLAVQWLGELSPFTTEELNTMAEKLKTKGAPKKTEAKADTKAAPAKKGGNTEALAKAREARAAASQEDRKYKALVKLKDAGLREGTWTYRMAEIILGNKSTNAAKEELATDKDYGGRRLDFSWAEKKGLIEFA